MLDVEQVKWYTMQWCQWQGNKFIGDVSKVIIKSFWYFQGHTIDLDAFSSRDHVHMFESRTSVRNVHTRELITCHILHVLHRVIPVLNSVYLIMFFVVVVFLFYFILFFLCFIYLYSFQYSKICTNMSFFSKVC